MFIPDNPIRDYEQLGLKFRLYSAEVLFNRGLCMVNTGQMDKGLQMMQEARREKATEEHNVIDEALADQGQGYTVFSIVSAPSYAADRESLYLHSISPSAYSTDRRRRNSRTPCRRTTWERLWVTILVVVASLCSFHHSASLHQVTPTTTLQTSLALPG